MKKMFIFVGAKHVSSNYHEDGSFAVVAEDEDRAIALAGDEGVRGPFPTPEVYELRGDPDERVFIFPDAGCC